MEKGFDVVISLEALEIRQELNIKKPESCYTIVTKKSNSNSLIIQDFIFRQDRKIRNIKNRLQTFGQRQLKGNWRKLKIVLKIDIRMRMESSRKSILT